MPTINWIAVLVAALFPLALGFVWYNPKVFGTAWMNASGMTPDDAKKANFPLIMGLSILFGLFLSLAMASITIHQTHIYSILINEPGFGKASSKVGVWLANFMKQYGSNFRTFKHGALHGTIASITIALPIIAIIAMYERKSFKYIMIHWGYWALCFILMGGLICGWTR